MRHAARARARAVIGVAMLAALLAAASNGVFPHRTGFEVASSIAGAGAGPVARVRWDTGYGFNDLQSRAIDPGGAPRFGRFMPVRAVEVTSVGGVSRILRPDELPPSDGLPRTGGERAFFLIGVLLISGVLVAWWMALRRLSRELRIVGAAILLVQASALALLWPGYLNPFNPVAVLEGFESHRFMPSESLLLCAIWAALFEAVPRLYVLSVVPALAFGVALLLGLERLRSRGWSTRACAGLAALMTLTPLSLVYTVFLERNVVSGQANALLVMAATLLLATSRRLSWASGALVTLLATVCVAVRADNLVIALPVTAYAVGRAGGGGWRARCRPRCWS